MAFTPTTWVEGAEPAITAAQLNRIEAGIDDAHAGSIDAGAIGTTELADGSVTEAKIGTGAVTNAKLGSGAVTEAKLGSSAVTNAKVAAGAVTPAKTSFLDSFGASGAVYVGRINGGGTALYLPSGWSVSRSSTGIFTVTHNLGVSTYVVVASPARILAVNERTTLNVVTNGTTSFIVHIADIATDTLGNADWQFVLLRYA